MLVEGSKISERSADMQIDIIIASGMTTVFAAGRTGDPSMPNRSASALLAHLF